MTRLRKNILLVLSLLTLIAALTAAEVWLQGGSPDVPPGTNVLIFALANVNAILLLALALLVFRNLAKLTFERRRRVIGARFRTRLALAFAALASLPALLLFLVSLKLITSSMQGWFDARVEQTLRLASDLAADSARGTERSALDSASRLAEEIGRLGLYPPGRREALARHLRGRVKEFGLAAAAWYPHPGSGPETSAEAPGRGLPALPPIPDERIAFGWAGRNGFVSTATTSGAFVQAFFPVREGPGQPVRGVAAAALFVPAEVGARLAAAPKTYESYRQLRLFRTPIRLNYTLTLATIALLITFSATWFAFYLSRVITTPIQQLAEGTRRVAGGDLDFAITVDAQDEIGLLVDSFNRMTRDLKSNKTELDGAYGNLQRSNLELERRRNQIETILETIATGVLALDTRGTVTTCNRSAEQMLGIAAADAVGHPFAQVFRDPALATLREAIEARRTSGEGAWEGRLAISAGGQLRTLVVNVVPLRDPRGTALGRLVVCEDLTQLVRAQRVAAWREAARRIAHEVKNPLTPIQLSIQRARKKFLERAPDREEVFLEAADTVISQVEAMKRLVDEFSRFARLPAPRLAPVDLREVLESALGLYRPERPGVEFVTRLPPEPLVVDGDAEQLRRVFINLTENALDALEGPGRITVEARLAAGGREAQVRVSDTGRGLPAEDRDRLFLPYVSTKKEGGGLGLAIVSDIVTEHGGSIRAEDNPPRGTVFTLEFPLHRAVQAPAGAAEVRHAG
jgi:two-component system nitrogen regulation sensor histidine kinase NtrY